MTTPLLLPLSPLPDQVFYLQLEQHRLKCHLRQKKYGLYLDLWIDGNLFLAGRLCLNQTFLLQDSTSPLSGDFLFTDTEGKEDPDYTGLGGRYKFYYK